MKVYNYSEARQNFASVLNTSLTEEVIIKRKDGSEFKVVPVPKKKNKSPFEVDGKKSELTTKEIVNILREEREYR